jgi:hypothetical protein
VRRPPLIGTLAAEIAADAAFRAKVAALYRRGPRLVAEMLAEIAAERALASYIDEKFNLFLALDDAALDVLSARDMPPAPLHKVEK